MSVDLQAAAWVALLVLGTLAAIICGEWWVRRKGGRIAAHSMKQMSDGREPPRLMPEGQYVVHLSEAGVSCKHPDGTVEAVAWTDLQRVEIVTTDEGPFVPDVFWVLHGSKSSCVIPQGATGERELMTRLQELPGFDNEMAIEACVSAADQHFLCWVRRENVG